MIDAHGLQRAVLELHRVEGTPEAALEGIARVVAEVLAPVRWVSITILTGDGVPVTAGHDGAPALEADAAQYAAGEGPCVEAARRGEPVLVPDVAAEPGWEGFTRAATAQGIRTAASVPFAPGAVPPGAVNLYGDRPSGFDDEGVAAALVLARHAGVAVANVLRMAEAEDTNVQLRTALRSRDEIGQAKGILMATRGLDADEAFALLRRVSMHSNVKLRDVAATVARTGALEVEPEAPGSA